MLNVLYQHWKMVLDNLPSLLRIHSKIIMGGHIPKPLDFRPWNVRITCFKCIRQFGNSFSYQNEIHKDGIKTFLVSEKSICIK